MGSDWRPCSLGDALTLQRGFDLPLAQRVNGPVPVIASTGQVGWHNRSAVNGPGVVIGRSGSLGGGQFIEGAYWPLNTTLWVKDFKGNDPRYCYYLIRSIDFQQFNVGSGVPTLNRNHIHPLPILLPPIDDQRRISGILAALDDRIDNLRQTNATLEAIAQALFKSWFVDFDPVRAKAEGREAEGMDAATAALFPSEFEESELGSIPKGWQVKQIDKLVRCLGGATPSTKNESFWEGGTHHWATPKDLSGLPSPALVDTDRRITDEGLSRISSGLLPAGTLLLSSRAPIGYLAISAVPTAINQGFIAIPPGGDLSPVFLLCWCKENMGLIKQSANGSTFMEISKKAFRPLPVCVPTIEIRGAFDQLAVPIFDKIKANELHRCSLTELRDTLLPRLISGKLRLPDAEREIEADTA